MPGPLTQQASVPAFIDRFDGSGVAGQVLTLSLKPVAPLGYVATKVKDNDQRRGWKELKEGAGEGTYALSVAAKTITLADAVEVGTDNVEVQYFYEPASGGGTQDVNIVGDAVGLNKEVTQALVLAAVDTLEAKVQTIRDQLNVLLGTRASEVTLASVLMAVDAVESQLSEILGRIGATIDPVAGSTNKQLANIFLAVDTLEAKQDALLAELQLKADVTETQPVSAVALPLPAGAATSAKQDDMLAWKGKPAVADILAGSQTGIATVITIPANKVWIGSVQVSGRVEEGNTGAVFLSWTPGTGGTAAYTPVRCDVAAAVDAGVGNTAVGTGDANVAKVILYAGTTGGTLSLTTTGTVVALFGTASGYVVDA